MILGLLAFSIVGGQLAAAELDGWAPRLVGSIDAVLDELESTGLHRRPVLHFETSIDVVALSAQSMLARHFDGMQMDLGPVGGPPTHGDLQKFRVSLGADVMPILSRLHRKLKSKRPRYFVYRVESNDEMDALIRESALPPRALVAGEGNVKYTLIGAYAEWRRALVEYRAQRRVARRPWTLERSRALQGPEPFRLNVPHS